MLTVNLDIQDCLNNGQTGNISQIEFAQISVQKLYVKFSDEQAGLKAVRSSLSTQTEFLDSYWKM